MKDKLFLLGTILALAVCDAGAQPVNVQANPDTGALFRPSAATFISGNGLLTSATAATTYAPIGATYITQTANGSLTGEQALSSLSTGLMQVTTTTGAITSVTTSAGVSALISDKTGTGALVFGTAPTITLANGTGLPISTGVTGLGTGIASALAANTGSAGAPVLFNGALGTPSSGTVTNLTGTASININGTVGATTPAAGTFTSVTNSGLTATRVPFAGTGGLMTDDPDMTFATDTLTVTKGTFGGITHVANAIAEANSVTAASATNLTLTGGSSGASLVLGQGNSGAAVVTPAGSGIVSLKGVVRANYNGTTNVGSVLLNSDSTVGVGHGQVTVYDDSAVARIVLKGDTAPSNPSTFAGAVAMATGAGNVLIGGSTDISGSGGLKVFGTTASTSTTTGSLINAGGFGNAGALYNGGKIVSTVTSGEMFLAGSATTGILYATLNNTGGNLIFGVENSAGGGIYSGTAAYSSIIGTGVNTALEFATQSIRRLTISGGGVVSVLSTTDATTGGAGSLTTAGGIYAAKKIVTSTDLIVGGIRIVSTDTLSGAGAVSVTKDTTKLTSTGGSQALTLADGVDGQIKRIIHDVDGGSSVLTPTTKTGFSTITFTNAGDTVTLEFVTTRGWTVVGSYGVTIAP